MRIVHIVRPKIIEQILKNNADINWKSYRVSKTVFNLAFWLLDQDLAFRVHSLITHTTYSVAFVCSAYCVSFHSIWERFWLFTGHTSVFFINILDISRVVWNLPHSYIFFPILVWLISGAYVNERNIFPMNTVVKSCKT